MGVCNVCDLEKGALTREHILGDSLGDKIIKGTNHVWKDSINKVFATPDFVIRDTCEDCQQDLRRTFDDRNEAFYRVLRGLETKAPTSITVEEPWFTLYCLRIFWNLRREKRGGDFPQEIKRSVVEYIQNGQIADFSQYSSMYVSFSQEPQFLIHNGHKLPLLTVETTKDEEFDVSGVVRVQYWWSRIMRLRINVFTLPFKKRNYMILHEFWKGANNGLAAVQSRWNEAGRQTYFFRNFCPETLQPHFGDRYFYGSKPMFGGTQ